MFNYPISFMSSGGVATNISFANMPFSGVLPMMYTNFGGDLQVSTIDPYSGYNFGVLFNPIAAQTWGISSMYANSPMTVPNGIAGAAMQQAQSILGSTYNNLASARINEASQSIQSSITKLEAKLAAEGTTDEEKAQIQTVLDKLKELAQKLDNLKKSTDLDPQTAYLQAKEISDEVSKTLRDAQQEAAERESASGNQPSAADENQPAADENQPAADGDQQAAQAGQAQNNGNQGLDSDPCDGSVDNFPMAVQNDTRNFFEAVNGMGTKNKEMEEILDAYTQDPNAMIGLMLCWNEKYSGVQNESFIQAFMDDADHSQARKYCPQIIDALVAKAKELGIYTPEFQACVDAANKEIYKGDSWGCFGALRGMDDEVICANIDAMVQAIGTKLGSQYAVPRA